MERKVETSISDCGSHSLKSQTPEHAKKLNPHLRTIGAAMFVLMCGKVLLQVSKFLEEILQLFIPCPCLYLLVNS